VREGFSDGRGEAGQGILQVVSLEALPTKGAEVACIQPGFKSPEF